MASLCLKASVNRHEAILTSWKEELAFSLFASAVKGRHKRERGRDATKKLARPRQALVAGASSVRSLGRRTPRPSTPRSSLTRRSKASGGIGR